MHTHSLWRDGQPLFAGNEYAGSAAIRIPMYAASLEAKRIEVRFPDPACNPYLAFAAATLMAGLDGIENKLSAGEPLDKDIYSLTPHEFELYYDSLSGRPSASDADRRGSHAPRRFDLVTRR